DGDLVALLPTRRSEGRSIRLGLSDFSPECGGEAIDRLSVVTTASSLSEGVGTLPNSSASAASSSGSILSSYSRPRADVGSYAANLIAETQHHRAVGRAEGAQSGKDDDWELLFALRGLAEELGREMGGEEQGAGRKV
ncbi:unnamed protein product, partial [Polarella glacialis]